LGIDLVNLGLVYGLRVEDGVAMVTMTLTTPGCPMGGSIPDQVRFSVGTVPGVREAQVELVWDPPWEPEMMSDAAKHALGWLWGSSVVQLDVRDLMARGEDPFAVIMEAVSKLADSESLELIAPLEPVPLYGVLEIRGYGHRTEDLGGGDYRVVFTPDEGGGDGWERLGGGTGGTGSPIGQRRPR